MPSLYLYVEKGEVNSASCPMCGADVLRVAGGKIHPTLCGWGLFDRRKIQHDQSDVLTIVKHECAAQRWVS